MTTSIPREKMHASFYAMLHMTRKHGATQTYMQTGKMHGCASVNAINGHPTATHTMIYRAMDSGDLALLRELWIIALETGATALALDIRSHLDFVNWQCRASDTGKMYGPIAARGTVERGFTSIATYFCGRTMPVHHGRNAMAAALDLIGILLDWADRLYDGDADSQRL